MFSKNITYAIGDPIDSFRKGVQITSYGGSDISIFLHPLHLGFRLTWFNSRYRKIVQLNVESFQNLWNICRYSFEICRTSGEKIMAHMFPGLFGVQTVGTVQYYIQVLSICGVKFSSWCFIREILIRARMSISQKGSRGRLWFTWTVFYFC